MPADNGVAAPEVVFARCEVHRATLATADTPFAPHHLRHQVVGVHAARDGNAVIAVRGDNMVIVAQSIDRPHADGLLAAVKMQINTGDLFLLVQGETGFFELPDQDHLAVPLQQCLFV